MGNVRVTVVNRIQNDLGEIARYACGMFVILSVLIDAEKPEIAFPGPGVLDRGRSLALCFVFVDAVWLAASGSHNCDFPATRDQLEARINHSSVQLLRSGYF